MAIRDGLGKDILLFDGAMGTMLQKEGLVLNAQSSLYNITHPDLIRHIHEQYLQAGAMVITTNTFLANCFNLKGTGYTAKDIISKAVAIVKEALENTGKKAYIALDIGSTGKRVKDLEEQEVGELKVLFKEQIVAGEEAGCDVILFETFMDLEELELAVKVAKETTRLPILATMSFQNNGVTFFGTTLEQMVERLVSLGVDGIGINCSEGPKEILPLARKMVGLTTLPIIIQPNAGLPQMVADRAIYPCHAQQFANAMEQIIGLGVSAVGGCCGTTPAYIKKVREFIKLRQKTS